MSLVIYTTSITMPPRQRSLQEHLIRTLSTLRIPYQVCDVSMDDDGKRLWRRKGRTDGRLPGFLVDGEYVGTLEEYEYAVEDGRVPEFLGVDRPGPAPPAPARTYAPLATPSLPPSHTTAPSAVQSTPQPEPFSPSASDARPPRSSPDTTTASADAPPRAAHDDDDDDGEITELLANADEDELEKLLRELEGH